jgi:exopolysaccharide production protein ExoZ
MKTGKVIINSRIDYLDYLRGFAALGILIYHYMSWTLGHFKADTVIARFGVYGVSIFYILSGLTLFHVYRNKTDNFRRFVMDFSKKRLLRILPLLCLAVIISLFLFEDKPGFWTLILNLTGLFGFFRWNDALVVGGWSIGNEMVFYVFFIFLMFFLKKNKLSFFLLSIVIFSFFLYFAFWILNPSQTLVSQWKDYVNPLNQVFLFLSGILIGLFFEERSINQYVNLFILVLGLIIFCFFPANNDTITIVTGVNRLIFTLSCILTCMGVYKLQFQLPKFIHLTFLFFGSISYSLYLLHPVFYNLCGKIINVFGNEIKHIETIRLFLSFVTTVLASFLIYRYYETFFINLGKNKGRVLPQDQPAASEFSKS